VKISHKLLVAPVLISFGLPVFAETASDTLKITVTGTRSERAVEDIPASISVIDLDDLRYGKIIIMTDADVDGSHIRALLLTFFNNKPFNKLIDNGHVFLAQPPLFKINKGSKGIYIKDEKELEKYIVQNSKEIKKIKKGSKEFEKKLQEEKSKISIQRFKGLGEMNPEELWNTTLNPETRNLLKVQYSKDLKKDHELIHTLMGNDVSLRKDFIVENAINVSNLDI